MHQPAIREYVNGHDRSRENELDLLCEAGGVDDWKKIMLNEPLGKA